VVPARHLNELGGNNPAISCPGTRNRCHLTTEYQVRLARNWLPTATLGYSNGPWVFPFAPVFTTIRVCRFMQLNLPGLTLEALAIGNRRVQVANFKSLEAVKFGVSAVTCE
jgi:hypothetical protein